MSINNAWLDQSCHLTTLVGAELGNVSDCALPYIICNSLPRYVNSRSYRVSKRPVEIFANLCSISTYVVQLNGRK